MTRMDSPRTIVAFDLDDTLYKEMDYVASGYRTVARALAATTGADAATLFDIISRHRPLGFEAALDHIAGMPGAEAFTVEGMIEIYRAHVPDIAHHGDAEATLESLKAHGVRLVLITDGSTRHQRAKIKALGLERYFAPDDILISEETGGDKTTDVPWNIVEARYKGARRVYVGDNLSKDFRLPTLRGWHTVMLRDPDHRNVFPQNPADWPPENRPQTTVDTLLDIPF